MTVESRSVVVRLSAETAQYIREMQMAGKVGADAMTKVEKGSIAASQAQGKVQKSSSAASKALDQVGIDAKTAGLGIVAGIGASALMASANFDEAMSSVQAATMESAEGMDALRQAALDAGSQTAFSATEAAAGIENLAKAGLSTQDILEGGLDGALDLAAAGGMEVADAAEAAAGALAQFKLEGDQATHVADLLAAGAGKAQGDVSDMVMALKQAGTVSAQTGLSLEETVGTLSAMAEQSLLGSDAGTSFKTMLASLTPNSEAAADAMAQYNINAFDAQGNFVGMTALAGQLRDGLSGLTDEQRAMALETIFGSDAVRAASIVYDNGAEGIANWTAKVDDAGFAAETAAIKLDNLKGDVEELKGALETAFIEGGSDNQGMLRGITQLATDTVNLTTEAEKADGVLGGLWSNVQGAINPLGRLGETYNGLKGEISGTSDASEDLSQSSDDAAGGLDAQSRAAATLAPVLREAEQMTKAEADALKELKEQAGDTARDFVGLGDSLDDSKVSLGEWVQEMNDDAAALENFTANAKKAAKNGLREGLIQELENAGTAGALRMKQLANATDEEIARANRAWARGQKAIDNYVDAVVKVPGEKSTTLNLKAMDAIADLIAFRNRLDEATQDRIHTITTVYKTVRSATDSLPDRTQRRAGGGLILGPGTTTSDSIPILASNKEYMIQAAAVDHYGVDFFDDANAMRLASGGATSGKKPKRRGEGGVENDETPQEQRDRERREELAERAAQEAEMARRFEEQRREEQARIEEARREEEARIAEAVLEGQQRAWDMAADAAKAQVDASKQMVETVEANMNRLGDAAVAGFNSPLFSSSGQQHGLWTGGGDASGGWRGALTGDIEGLRERSSLITQLSDPSLGLSPEALEALLGQADNAQIRAMLAAGEVDDYAALFAERARLTGDVSTQAGMAGYGGQYAAAVEQQTLTNQKLDQLMAVIAGARGITVYEAISAEATAAETARLISMGF